MGWIAGAARVNITPAVGCFLDGYGGRTHGAEGVRDELWARALYLSDGATELVLISAEILGLTRDSVERIQERVHKEAGIPRAHVICSATHTHSGPKCRSSDLGNPVTERNLAVTEDKVAGAAVWARANARPALLHRHEASTLLGVNRRERRDGRIVLGIHPEGPVDPSVDVLHVTDEHGRTVALWYAHACHPVVMGWNNYLVSGDYPGAASRFLEEATGGIALFANGATGNINSLPHNGTFADVDRLGTRLGAAVLASLTTADETTKLQPSLKAIEHPMLLPLDPVPTREEAESRVQAARDELARCRTEGNTSRIFWAGRSLAHAEAALALAQGQEEVPGAPVTLSIAAIGDLALVGVPAEVFVELGLDVRRRAPFRRTVVLSYTGGYQGYLPTAAAFADGGYEVDVRIRHKGLAITSQAGASMVDESVRLLKSLAPTLP